MPSPATETPAATVVSGNPLTRVQNEERYAIVSIIVVASLDYSNVVHIAVEVSRCAVSPRPCDDSLDLQPSAHHGFSSLDEWLYHLLPFCFSIIPDVSCTLYQPPYIISRLVRTALIPNACA